MRSRPTPRGVANFSFNFASLRHNTCFTTFYSAYEIIAPIALYFGAQEVLPRSIADITITKLIDTFLGCAMWLFFDQEGIKAQQLEFRRLFASNQIRFAFLHNLYSWVKGHVGVDKCVCIPEVRFGNFPIVGTREIVLCQYMSTKVCLFNVNRLRDIVLDEVQEVINSNIPSDTLMLVEWSHDSLDLTLCGVDVRQQIVKEAKKLLLCVEVFRQFYPTHSDCFALLQLMFPLVWRI